MIPGSVNPLLLAADAAAPTGYQIQRSLRFNSSDSAYLSKNFASAGNRKTWTWAGWVKRSSLSAGAVLFDARAGSPVSLTNISFGSDNTITIVNFLSGTSTFGLTTTAVFRDPSAWYHITVAFDTTNATAANRVKIYVNGVEQTVGLLATYSTTYPAQNTDSHINNNIPHAIASRATAGDYFSGYLADIHFIDGQALTPTSFGEFSATTGVWMPKAYSGTYGTNGFQLKFADNSSNTATTLGKDTSGNGNNWTPNNFSVLSKSGYTGPKYSGNGTFSAPGSPWIPTPNWHLWFDGDLTTFGAAYAYYGTSTSTLNFSTPISGSVIRFYAENPSQPGTFPDDVGTTMYVRLNGQAAIALTFTSSGTAPNAVGWTDAISIPGSSLTQLIVYHSATTHRNIRIYGVEVDYALLNEVTLADVDTDSLVDVPTNGSEVDTGAGGQVRGNYCTLNPLISTSSTLSNGNLDYASTATYQSSYGTIAARTGKWYWEGTVGTFATDALIGIGSAPFSTATYVGGSATSWGYEGAVGRIYNNGNFSAYGSTFGAGDIIGVAFDANTGKLWFAKNGTWQASGNPASGTSPGVTLTTGIDYFFGVSAGSGGTWSCNWGARPFAYTAPSGFKALCTANLPAPVVTKPSTVMDVVTYTGTGTTQTVSSLAFSPDFAWGKGRSTASSHVLVDTIRGAGAKLLYSNLTNAENAYGQQWISSFDSNGFTMSGDYNANGFTYAAWCWDAGTTTVTNTQGSISSQVRANASAGFSIVTYTGTGSNATVGHGLGVSPSLVIIKPRSAAYPWSVYHSATTANGYLLLNATDSYAVNSTFMNNTAPTSTVFSLGTGTYPNSSGTTHVAYCFAPVVGYSSFGSYTGNGSSDGPFVYTGHRSRWVMVKRTDATSNWTIWDTSRDPFNYAGRSLYPNLSNAEDANTPTGGAQVIDVLSNGFKLRDTGGSGQVNASGGTYIWASFAESPFQYARAR